MYSGACIVIHGRTHKNSQVLGKLPKEEAYERPVARIWVLISNSHKMPFDKLSFQQRPAGGKGVSHAALGIKAVSALMGNVRITLRHL